MASRLPAAGCMGRGVGLVVQVSPPSAVPCPQPGPSMGLGFCCTVAGFAPTPLLHLPLQVKGSRCTTVCCFQASTCFQTTLGKLLAAAASLSSLPEEHTKTVASY